MLTFIITVKKRRGGAPARCCRALLKGQTGEDVEEGKCNGVSPSWDPETGKSRYRSDGMTGVANEAGGKVLAGEEHQDGSTLL